jgi:hypothetical protein
MTVALVIPGMIDHRESGKTSSTMSIAMAMTVLKKKTKNETQ